MKLRLGWSGWGFLSDDYAKIKTIETPDGACYIRSLYLKALTEQFDIFWLQKEREKNLVSSNYNVSYDDKNFPELDILFIEWRWPTWKNDKSHKDFKLDKFEPDLERQSGLIDYYSGKIPIIIWDTDFKINDNDEIRKRTVVLDSSIKGYEKQQCFLYFDDKSEPLSILPTNDYFVYIGANYERENHFQKYYYDSSKILKQNNTETHVWGNWLNFSPERESPEQVLAKWGDNINFHKRCNRTEHIDIYRSSLATVNITKNEYSKIGAITSRCIETLKFGLVPFVPKEIYNANIFYGNWFVVDSAKEVADKVLFLKHNYAEKSKLIKQALTYFRDVFSNVVFSESLPKLFKSFL